MISSGCRAGRPVAWLIWMADSGQSVATIASGYKIPVGFFSLEMDKESFYLKAFSLRIGIDYQKLRSPKENGLTPEEFQDFKIGTSGERKTVSAPASSAPPARSSGRT